jgi:hypothetical protein
VPRRRDRHPHSTAGMGLLKRGKIKKWDKKKYPVRVGDARSLFWLISPGPGPGPSAPGSARSPTSLVDCGSEPCFMPAQLPQLLLWVRAWGPSVCVCVCVCACACGVSFLLHREISQSRPRTEKPVRHDTGPSRANQEPPSKTSPATHCDSNSALPPPSR